MTITLDHARPRSTTLDEAERLALAKNLDMAGIPASYSEIVGVLIMTAQREALEWLRHCAAFFGRTTRATCDDVGWIDAVHEVDHRDVLLVNLFNFVVEPVGGYRTDLNGVRTARHAVLNSRDLAARIRLTASLHESIEPSCWGATP